MDADRTRLADRILKLLALAAGTTFEAEAATARRMADELMAKHNLEPGSGAKDRAAWLIENYTPHFKRMRWEFILFDAACQLCGCKSYWYGDFELFTAIGTAANVEACIYIVRKLHEQRMRDWLAYKPTGADSFHQFCYAYAMGLEGRVLVMIKPMPALRQEREAAKLWYEASHSIKKTELHLGKPTSGAGLEAGKSASLHRGEMGGPQRQRQLR